MTNLTIHCRYTYDPLGRLASRMPLPDVTAQRFYKAGQLATELQGAAHRSFVRSGTQLLAQTSQTNTVLLGADQQNSVLQADDTTIAYAPYGHAEEVGSLPGFTGEQPDPITGHYLLGNGYRAYDPVLMRFNSPDSLSPFAGGGLNPYSYCLGDPINRVDPTGHLSWQAGLGFGLSALGIVASILSFSAATPLAIAGLTTGLASSAAGVAQAVTEESNPEASSVLGWVGLGLGVASAGFGVASGYQGVRSRLPSLSSRGHKPMTPSLAPSIVSDDVPDLTDVLRQFSEEGGMRNMYGNPDFPVINQTSDYLYGGVNTQGVSSLPVSIFNDHSTKLLNGVHREFGRHPDLKLTISGTPLRNRNINIPEFQHSILHLNWARKLWALHGPQKADKIMSRSKTGLPNFKVRRN